MENVRKHWNIKLITTEKEEISKITAYEFWYDYLIVLRMGRFGAAQGCLGLEGGRGAKEAPLPKFYHTYSTMMSFDTVMTYLSKIQEVYESSDTPFEFY